MNASQFDEQLSIFQATQNLYDCQITFPDDKMIRVDMFSNEFEIGRNQSAPDDGLASGFLRLNHDVSNVVEMTGQTPSGDDVVHAFRNCVVGCQRRIDAVDLVTIGFH